MSMTISRLYDDYNAARAVVGDLERAGLRSSDISIVASNVEGAGSGRIDRDRDGTDDRAEGAETGAGIGAVLGGAAGLLAGLGVLAIPGVGPVVAAGWLTATAAGAVVGGAAGGIVGGLTQAGVSKEDAQVYAEGVRRGGTLVSARVPEADRDRYEAILDHSAVDIQNRGAAYRGTGWRGFDPAATPYTPDQVRAERDLYR
jgi:hypothetical protein